MSTPQPQTPAQSVGPLSKSGNKPLRGPTLPKTTTTNRIALASGLAAAASEARKSKKQRPGKPTRAPLPTCTHNSNKNPAEEAQEALGSQSQDQENARLLTPSITSISVPMDAIPQEPPAPPIVTYQSSDQGDTPPPFPTPDLINESSVTPPATPTRPRGNPPPSIPLLTNATPPDAPMPLACSLVLTPILDPATPATPPPRALPRNEANPNPFTPVLPPILVPSSTKNRLEAAANRNNTLAGKFTPRNALDKYTAGPLPLVHDAYPTAVFEHIDTDFAAEWEQHKGGKLLAHPFDSDAQNSANHEEIRELIFTAASEITKSVEVEVSAPIASEEAKKERRFPTVFLIFNLSDDHVNLLLQRGVWSSPAITFRVLPFRPPCPNFMFSIGSISTHSVDTIFPIVQRVWDGPDTKIYITALINAVPEDKRGGVENAICLLMDSMWVEKLETKRAGETIAPHYNIYTDSSGIAIDEVWIRLRNHLSARTYSATFQGTGKIKTPPFHCGVCHSADHPRGLCPFPDIPGWNGPKKRPIMENANRRGYRPYNSGSSSRSNRFIT